MKNFNWDEFMNDKVAVHCDTEEKANDFLRECHDIGMTWYTNNSLLDYTNWNYYMEYICYEYKDDSIRYSDLDYFQKKNYTIIEWEIEDTIKFNWSDFKQGKFVVKINDDNRQQFIKEIKEKCKDIKGLNRWNYDSYYYYIDNNIIECLDKNYSCNKYVIDFIPNMNNNKYEIYIISDGIETNCVYKLNDKIVNKSSAKLNSIDKFDFKECAKICIDKVFKDNIIKKGTEFKVFNTNKHNDSSFVCLDAYIGKIGTLDNDCDLNNTNKFLTSGTFQKEYLNAIDKENGKLIWHQSEVEILGD